MEDRYFCIGNYWKIHNITAGSAPTLQKMDGHMYSGYLGCRQSEETGVMKD